MSNADDAEELQRMRRQLRNIRGLGVRQSREGIHILPTARRRDRRPQPEALVAFVRIQATEDGGGKYSGVLLLPPTDPTDSDEIVSQDDLGDVGDDIYIINALERDQDTHDLNLDEGLRPKDFIGLYLYNDPDDGTPTYGIVGFQISDCDDDTVSGGSF